MKALNVPPVFGYETSAVLLVLLGALALWAHRRVKRPPELGRVTLVSPATVRIFSLLLAVVVVLQLAPRLFLALTS